MSRARNVRQESAFERLLQSSSQSHKSDIQFTN
jgi:hypothetical protein